MNVFSSLLFVLLLFFVTSSIEGLPSNNIFSSIFSFGKKKPPATTISPISKGSASSRCNLQTSQCSAYECCNSDQTCLRNRCFPRIKNCPVTRDQCGYSCCKTSEQCRNGQCVR